MIERPTYIAPKWFHHPHFHTIVANFRKVIPLPSFQQRRVETPDNDFFNIELFHSNDERLAVVLHGLEGHSHRPYMRGMAHALINEGYSVLLVNFRGCGGLPNKKLPSYHSGFTHDLRFLIPQLAQTYRKVFLIGFSVGGNIVTKYLGEEGSKAHSAIQAAVGISVPFDLEACAQILDTPSRILYRHNFLRTLKGKILIKEKEHAGALPYHKIRRVRKIVDYDELVTAPLFQYKNASHYYSSNSSVHFLSSIERPMLFLSSFDDPFFNARCFPTMESFNKSNLSSLYLSQGGHVAFLQKNDSLTFAEKITLEYLKKF